MNKKIVNFSLQALIYLFLSFIAVITLFPLIYTFFASFKTNQEILSSGANIFPVKWAFENYSRAWLLADFKRYTWNSVYMTTFIVVGVLINSSMGGYVFSRGKFRGKNIVFALFTSTMFIAMGSITLFPLMQIAKFLRINTTLLGVIIIYVFGLNVTNLYLVRGFIQSVPYEIDEAAKIDGCGFFKIFWAIMMPLIKPILATIGILTFRQSWNDYLLPMVFTLANPKQAPLVVGVVALKSTGEAASSWNLMLAGTMISIVPMLAAYLFLNRYFVKGLTTGAVKG